MGKQERRTLSSNHESYHRLEKKFNDECPLCLLFGKEAIERGTAPRISLSKKARARGLPVAVGTGTSG